MSPPPASQTDSRSSHPRYVSGKISPTSSPAQLSSTRSTRAATGGRTGSRHGAGGPTTRKVNPSSRQNHRPLRRSSVLACATERVPPPPLPISPALSPLRCLQKDIDRELGSVSALQEATCYTVSTPARQEGDLYCYMAKKGINTGGQGINSMRSTSHCTDTHHCVAVPAPTSSHHPPPPSSTTPSPPPPPSFLPALNTKVCISNVSLSHLNYF